VDEEDVGTVSLQLAGAMTDAFEKVRDALALAGKLVGTEAQPISRRIQSATSEATSASRRFKL
jgi:hypothetical protein